MELATIDDGGTVEFICRITEYHNSLDNAKNTSKDKNKN